MTNRGRVPRRLGSSHSVIVTGAASGIGRAMAVESAMSGLDVVLVDRDAEGIADAARTIDEYAGGRVLDQVAVDLSDPDGVTTVLDSLRSLTAVPMRLFHAAGSIIRSDSVDEDWNPRVGVNQQTAWFLTRAFCQLLQQYQLTGAVALLSSISVSLGLMSGSSAYATTKAGISSMVKGFAKTYGPAGIRVNAIAPGLVETPMVRGGVRDREVDRLVETQVPLQRTAQPAEVAQAGLFLLSDNASYISGITLDVDGGWPRR